MSMIFNGTGGLTFPDASVQAESMTDYGIGTTGPVLSNLDNFDGSGIYTFTSSSTNKPSFILNGTVLVIKYSSTQAVQIAMSTQNETTVGIRRQNTTWKDWYKIWTTDTDGNGGQPPAPKPQISDNTIAGYEDTIPIASGNTYTLPSGGQWIWCVTSPYNAKMGSGTRNIAAGGDTLSAATTDLTLVIRRIAG